MTQENVEKENSLNQVEGETTKETPIVDQATTNTPESIEEALAQRDRVYKRLKDSEAKAKNLEQKLNQVAETNGPTLKPAQISEAVAAFRGLDERERTKLIKESENNGISLVEARNEEDFKLWRSSYRAKLQKDNAPTPSTKQGTTTQGKEWDNMSLGEQEDWMKNLTLNGQPFQILKPEFKHLQDRK